MPSEPAQRPTWAEIDLDALAFNFHAARKFIGEDLSYLAVVKADAYGHGAVECSRRLDAEGVDWFGVALPEEGVEPRAAGISRPILCLGSFWPGQEELLLKDRLTAVIYQTDAAELLDRAANEAGQVADIHIKVDTGMGRIGVRFDEVDAFVEKIGQFKNLSVEGLMTHFAAADDLDQNSFTELQIERFNRSVDIFRAAGFEPKVIDLANSPGAVVHQSARGNMVRLGGVLYGLVDDILPARVEKPEFRPVMSLYSSISHLKTVPAGESLGYGRTFTTRSASLIATVPIGYSDGYPRSLSNKVSVLVNDVLVPVVGRISMDWTIVDVTGVPNVKVGDKVTLIGGMGDHKITAADLAGKCGTISYEITCGIKRRVKRMYVGTA